MADWNSHSSDHPCDAPALKEATPLFKNDTKLLENAKLCGEGSLGSDFLSAGISLSPELKCIAHVMTKRRPYRLSPTDLYGGHNGKQTQDVE